jgi:hypothetical protein
MANRSGLWVIGELSECVRHEPSGRAAPQVSRDRWADMALGQDTMIIRVTKRILTVCILLWAFQYAHGVCRVHAFQATVTQSPWGYQAFLDHIEQAAWFPRIRTEPLPSTSREIRVLNWTPTAMIPMAVVRLIETRGIVEAQLVVAWHTDVSPSIGQPRRNVRCDPNNPSSACVELFEPPFLRPPPGDEWTTLFADLIALAPCQDATSGVASISSDSGDLVIQLREGSTYREYYCNDPRGHRATPSGQRAGALLNYLDGILRQALGR